MSGGNGITPTQEAMLDILEDGKLHTREELHTCLPDKLGGVSNIKKHLSNLRKSLRPKGRDVICVFSDGGVYYQFIRYVQR